MFTERRLCCMATSSSDGVFVQLDRGVGFDVVGVTIVRLSTECQSVSKRVTVTHTGWLSVTIDILAIGYY